MAENQHIIISWCPHGIGVREAEGHINFSPLYIPEDEILPEISENMTTCDAVYLPMEDMLVRHFTFPLKHPRFLDSDILLEELDDIAGIEPDDWWLTWQADTCENGIAGMVFGIRKSLQNALSTTVPWQSSPLILVDGWQRLNHALTAQDTDVAVVDADADGVFFGMYQHGVWTGMRRLNADMHNQEQTAMAEQILWSLQAMGFDADNMQVQGQLTPAIAAVFPESALADEARVETSLAQRHITNLTLPLPSPSDKQTLNFRHGSWAKRTTPAALRAWYRPALIATGVCFLWLGSLVVDNYRMQHELDRMNEAIAEAFHRGLPEQPVIIDAIAQLRQAANDTQATSASQVSKTLEHISKVFQDTPWQMQEFNLIRGSVTLAGKVKSLDALNNIRNQLSKLSGADVQIADTNLNGDNVSFRMRW